MNKKILLVLTLVFVLTVSLLTACSANEEEELGALEDVEEDQDIEEADIEAEEDEFGIISNVNSVEFVDGLGKEVEITKNPGRVVILFASYIDIWMDNGGENIVGIVEPSEEYITPEIEDIKTVGKRGSISLEEVIGLEPELVIVSANTSDHVDMIAPLEASGSEVLALDYSFKEDYFETAKLFATINDGLDLYEAQAGKVKREIEEIMDMVPNEGNPSAAIIMSTKSNTSLRTSKTTIGEIFKDLKVENIADLENNEEGNKDFSLETIIDMDPDFIFLQTMGSDLDAVKDKMKSDVESNPAWSSLSAVKNDRYILLEKELYTYKANDRYGEAYKNLAEILYPEIFN